MKTAKRLASLLLCFALLTVIFAGTVNVQAQAGGGLSIDSFSLNVSSPQPAGSQLTMTASGSGGTGGLQYKFSYEKDGMWVRIQDYSKASTATWRPPEPGDYTVTVFIKDSSGTEIAKGIPFTAEDPIPVEVTSFTVDPSSSQPAGSAVSLAASASGGQGGFQYKFSYEKDGAWVRIQDFSPSPEAQWIPMEPGAYTLVVFVQDAAGTEEVKSAQFQVTDPPALQVDSITVDPGSSGQVGDEVTLRAQGSGGAGKLQYKFSYEKDGSWVRIQDYSFSNTAQWQLQEPGDYTVTAFIKDGTGMEIAKGTAFHVEAGPSPEITRVSVDKPSPQPAGNALQISAQAASGVGSLSYKFSYEKDGSWVRIQDYSSSQTATWVPQEPGTYKVVAFVKDSQGIEVAKGVDFQVTEAIPLRVTSFTASPPSPQYTGTSIQLTAQAEGEGELEYQFLYRTDGPWQELQGYSSKNTALWQPKSEGVYSLAVSVKNREGQEITQILSYEIQSKSPIVIEDFQANVPSPQLTGTEIRLTAYASGGKGTLQYRFAYQKDGKWETLQDNSPSHSMVWIPETAGSYTLGVFVTDETGSQESKTMEFQVRSPNPIEISSLVASPEGSQTLGGDVALAASASGGEGALQYRFAYQKSGEEWKTVQDYSQEQAALWTPEEAGEYRLAVFVKDSLGNEEQTSISYQVEEPDPVEITEFRIDHDSPQQPGTAISLFATAKGGVGDYEYRFGYQEGDHWVYLGDYSTKNYITWVPTEPGTYVLAAFAEDRLGAEGYTTAEFIIEDREEPLEITGFSTEQDSPQLEGSSIRMTAQAQGATGSYEYQFSYQKAGENWNTIQDYSDANHAVWTPQEAGLYTLRVSVRSGEQETSQVIEHYVINRYIADDTGGIALTGSTRSVPAGKSLYIKAGSSNVQWTTNNPSIATVSKEGYILGVNPGEARIVAYDDYGNRVSCYITVEEAQPVKFSYTSPNIVPKNGEVTLVAITDLDRSMVEFDVEQNGGITSVRATEKVRDGDTYKWTAKMTVNSAGVFTVKAYSKVGDGGWETCDDGKTTIFVTNSTDIMTTRVEERRASDRCLDFIATCEGFSSQVYPDTVANNIPTVAYGYVFYPGDTFYNNLTKDEGWALLVQETNRGGYTTSVNRFLMNNQIRCNQQQFDSLISFSYNVGTGWITNSSTQDLRNILLRARSTNPGTGGGGATITTGIVSGGGQGINIRSGPGTNYPVLYALSDGTVVQLIDETKYNGDWYKLKTTDGSAAYCHSDYIVNVVTTGGSGGTGELDLNYVDQDALITEMSSWHHAGGKCVLGLLTRRFDELEIFLYGEYNRGYRLSDHHFPIPDCYQ